MTELKVETDINKILYPIKVEVDNKDLKPGDEVKISVDGIDKTTDRIFLTYENLESNWEIQTELIYNKKTKRHEGYLNVSPYITEGTWAVGSIQIMGDSDEIIVSNKDLYPNEIYKKDFRNADISVKGTIKDTQAPVLKNISLNKTQFKPGD